MKPTRKTTTAGTRSRKARKKAVAGGKAAMTRKRTKKAGATKKLARRTPGGKKMKAYASFDLWFADQPPGNQRLIRALRAFVRRAAPKLEESVKWGNGCWVKGDRPVAYAYSDEDHVQFGFFRGASLADPRGLLEGKGQYVRHVKVRQPADIDEKAFAALLRQAVR